MHTLLFISFSEIFIVFLFALIFFGADKMPELARGLGKGMREIKKATDDIKNEFAGSEISRDLNNMKRDFERTLEENITKPVENMSRDIEQSTSAASSEFNKVMENTASDVNTAVENATSSLNRSVESATAQVNETAANLSSQIEQGAKEMASEFPTDDFYFNQETSSEIPS